jgi:hypothetical protein
VKLNPNNPRVIEGAEFNKLVDSVKEDGFMMGIRFLVIDKDNVVVGGNQRLKACQKAGMEQVPVVRAEDLTEDELKEFVLRDNTYYGTFDHKMIAESYSDTDILSVGLPLIDFSQPSLQTIGDIEPEIDASYLAKRKEFYENNEIKQIVTYFPVSLYDKIIESMDVIKAKMQCKENPEVLLNLITYWKQHYAD